MRAKFLLMRERPFLKKLIALMEFIPTQDTPSMMVNESLEVFYNPQVLERDVGELACFLYHEALHVAFNHFRRMKKVNAPLAVKNIAMDLEINDNIKADIARSEKIRFPQDFIHPSDLGLPEGLTAEEYLRYLISRSAEFSDLINSYGQKHAPGLELTAPEGKGKKIRGKDRNLIGKLAKEVIREGLRAGKLRGRASSLLDPERQKPSLPWQVVLARLARKIYEGRLQRLDVTFRKRKKRNPTEFILPSEIGYTYNPVVVIDTSGSMTSDQIRKAVAECVHLLRLGNSKIRIILFDAGLQGDFYTDNPLKDLRKIPGRGGTRMDLALEYVAKKARNHSPVIVFTDGETPWNEVKPVREPVIVCLLSRTGSAPYWAKEFHIERRGH